MMTIFNYSIQFNSITKLYCPIKNDCVGYDDDDDDDDDDDYDDDDDDDGDDDGEDVDEDDIDNGYNVGWIPNLTK
jgi:hypothetical protein